MRASIIDGSGRKIDFDVKSFVFKETDYIELHPVESVIDLLPVPIKYEPARSGELAVLCANLAEEPWLSMNALADKLTEEGRELEADGFRFLVKGKHVPLMNHDSKGDPVWYWSRVSNHTAMLQNQIFEVRGYGHMLPRMVYQSNRISRVSQIQAHIVPMNPTGPLEPLRDAILFPTMYEAWINAVWAWGDVQTTMKNIMTVKKGG